MNKSAITKIVAGSAAAVVGTSAGAFAQDSLEGFYLGASVSMPQGGSYYLFDGGTVTDEGGVAGLFGGYNFVNDNVVYGVDVAIHGEIGLDSGYADSLQGLTDVRGRIGTEFGNTFVYAAVGYSFVDLGNMDTSDGDYNLGSDSGLSLGVGFETSLSEKMFLGFDYTHRKFDREWISDKFEARDLNTVTLRLGFRF